ncbi:ABC-2 type transport system ATP-binding protein [Kineosphaera limosa]|uniref:Putative ABC transporter ATP-binding protein n=1 Tax=Kineosphaera limosa NBRC 100340 TaxID=1184609 RepID=K6VII8_9MICO|nr:ABC transporter ATP-binding protein [Kineosphaera limosa]NYE02425.1 ABC-2 type transport system ATP-binding protein [Kineosphaera limosa]GAB96048.1 putative ABC transporter ATP-binding protein [Kineosphaera limosa NBRC 100340]
MALQQQHATTADPTTDPSAHGEPGTELRLDPGVPVRCRGLRRRYGRGSGAFEAVRGVDLHARAGEMFALLGTNGAGKTSTLEVLEGLARPSAGQVQVLGLDPYTQRRKVRPSIGIMLQEAGFASGTTVRQAGQLWAGTMAAPMPVDEALELVGLAHRRRVEVQNLSGGERRRLDLAMAVLGRPRVLFLDEPTTGLDPESRSATWSLLTQLLESGTCVVLTTHYLEEAERLADRIAIMHEGRIVRTGTLDEVVADEPAAIEFEIAPGSAAAELPALPDLPGARVARRGGRVRIETDLLQDTLARVLTWADGVELPRLQARAASLEQVFLRIAGGGDPITLRDAA